MSASGLDPRRRKKRIVYNAARLSGLFLLLSALLIILSGLLLGDYPTWQTIVFSIFGAFLQTATLGLIYEVWLRNEIEDATLEKLNVGRDVREHGLIRMHRNFSIDWNALLETATELRVVTTDPAALFSWGRDQVLRKAEEGQLRTVRIAVASDCWSSAESWLREYAGKWSASAPPDAHLYCYNLPSGSVYEVVGTEERAILSLPLVLGTATGIDQRQTLEFRENEPWGTGAWINKQLAKLDLLTPQIGYSPQPASSPPHPPPSEDDDDANDDEQLT